MGLSCAGDPAPQLRLVAPSAQLVPPPGGLLWVAFPPTPANPENQGTVPKNASFGGMVLLAAGITGGFWGQLVVK